MPTRSGTNRAGWYVVPNSDPTVAPGLDGAATSFNTVPPAQAAKNSLVVRVVDLDSQAKDDAGFVTDLSSYGPTDDGRIRPDVVASGEPFDVLGPFGSSSYDAIMEHPGPDGLAPGTSFAAPAVLGNLPAGSTRFANQRFI